MAMKGQGVNVRGTKEINRITIEIKSHPINSIPVMAFISCIGIIE